MVEAIKFGVPVTGQTDSVSPTDNYTFNANRGDKLWVNLVGSSPNVSLYDPNDRFIGGVSYNESGPLTANLTGTYTLSVGAVALGYGNYWLTLQRTNRPGNAKAIAFGSTVPVNIENYEEDAYTFVGRANTKISIGVSGGISAGVSFFGPDGSVLETVADSSNSTTSNKSLATLTQDGTYTILVSNTQAQNETYDLKVSNLGTPKGLNLNGTSSDDYLEGDYGYDTINGLAGNDNLRGNHGNDRLLGGDGNDTLYGRSGNDRLLGGNGNDTLYGGTGKDILNGGKGDDLLIGDEDRYFGYPISFQDKDRFLFDTGRKFQRSDTGIDTIQDFDRFSDKIILDKTTFTSLNSVAGPGFSVTSEFAVVKTDGAASTSQAEIVYNSANGKLFYNPNRASSGYGEGGFFALLTDLTNAPPALAKNNFILQA